MPTGIHLSARNRPEELAQDAVPPTRSQLIGQAMSEKAVTAGKVSAADMDFQASLPSHAHEALVSGKWDAIADLLEGIPDIKKVAATLPYFEAA